MSVSLIMLSYFSVLAVCSRWYYTRFDRACTNPKSLAERAEELNNVLKDVGQTAATYFWRTDKSGLLSELSDKALFASQDQDNPALGRDILELFIPSQERDLLRSRLARQSEIVALELESC